MRADVRTHFCAAARRNGYGVRARLHAGKRAWSYPFLRTHWLPTVPVSASHRRFAAQAPNPFLRSSLPARRTCFCGAARRNGYAGAAGERRKPLANKGFYPQKQVRRFARAVQDHSPVLSIARSFSDESCEDRAAAVLRHAAPSLCRLARPQKRVRRRPTELDRSVYSLFCKPQEYAPAEIAHALEPADLGTHAGSATSQNHAETGTHRLARHGRSGPNGRFPRRNGYAETRKRPQGRRRRAFSVDNTVDNPMLSPQIPVRLVRRSRYGFAQKRVRSHAESGSHVRRIEYGFAPQTQMLQGFAGRVYGLPVVNVRGIYDW